MGDVDMKTGILLLSCYLAAVQTVSFTNCCRGALCDKKDHCPPCQENAAEGKAPDDCCGAGAPRNTSRPGCVHLEPSSDVAPPASSDPPVARGDSVLLEPGAAGTPSSEALALAASLLGLPPPIPPAPLYLIELFLRL